MQRCLWMASFFAMNRLGVEIRIDEIVKVEKSKDEITLLKGLKGIIRQIFIFLPLGPGLESFLTFPYIL